MGGPYRHPWADRRPVQSCRTWNPEDLAALRKAAEEGMPTREIAALLGRSTLAVVGRAQRERISLKRAHWLWPPEDLETLRQMVRDGYEAREVAVRLDRTEEAVRRHGWLNGVRWGRPGGPGRPTLVAGPLPELGSTEVE